MAGLLPNGYDRPMTDRDILIAFVSSLVGAIIGGFVVFATEQIVSILKERRRTRQGRVVRNPNAEKLVSENLFHDLSPGTTIALMRQMLGVPNNYARLDFPVFSEDEAETHSYLYIFQNAFVKITSRDNETISTLTVLPLEDSFPMSSLLLPDDVTAKKFRDFIVTPQLVEYEYNHTYISTLRDSAFAIEFLTGAPTHLHYVFFGYGGSREEYENANGPKVFIGQKVNGLCISSTEEAYYIYDNELL